LESGQLRLEYGQTQHYTDPVERWIGKRFSVGWIRTSKAYWKIKGETKICLRSSVSFPRKGLFNHNAPGQI
jgi:hypothetical protein